MSVPVNGALLPDDVGGHVSSQIAVVPGLQDVDASVEAVKRHRLAVFRWPRERLPVDTPRCAFSFGDFLSL